MIASTELEFFNVLYKAWGFLGVLAVVLVAVLPAIWVNHTRKHSEVLKAVLRIRVALVRIFERTVLDEASRFFKLVESKLPSIIAERVASKDDSTAFGMLCRGLRAMKEDPSENEFSELLQISLAGVITTEVERLFGIASSNMDGERKPAGIAAEVRVSFEEDTETKLTLVARKLADATRLERNYYTCSNWTTYSLCILTVGFLLTAPCTFINHDVAEIIAYAFLGVAGISGVAAASFFAHCHKYKERLQHDARTLTTTEELQEEYESGKEGSG